MSRTSESIDRTSGASLENSAEHVEAEEKVAWYRIIYRFFFLVSFSVAMWLAHGNEYGYYLMKSMDANILDRHYLFKNGQADHGFEKTSNVDDIYLWLKGPLINTVFQNKYFSRVAEARDRSACYDECVSFVAAVVTEAEIYWSSK